MAVMQPLQQQWVNPPSFVQSAYSYGGAMAPTPANNYNNTPISPGYNFNANNNSSGGMMSPIDAASYAQRAGNFVSNGFRLPQSNFINNLGTPLGFGNPAAILPGAANASGIIGNAAGLGVADAAFAGKAAGAAGFGDMAGVANAAAGLDAAAAGGATAASLSSVLGAAGIGALAGNFLGKIGGNSLGGSIGGAIGAGAGMALGSQIGMIGGPPGAIIGGLIGGIGGGFFGNKSKPTNADTYGAIINPTGTLGAGGATSKNPGQYAGFGRANVDNFSAMAQQAHKDLGVNFDPKYQVNAGISTQHGGAYFDLGLPNEGPRERFSFSAGDQKSTDAAMLKMLQATAAKSGFTDAAAIDNWYAQKTASNASAMSSYNMPKVQLNNDQFADFMTKNRPQGTV